MVATPLLEQVYRLVQQLPQDDKLRLIARLAQLAVLPVDEVGVSEDATWEAFFQAADESQPLTLDSADVLSEMRR